MGELRFKDKMVLLTSGIGAYLYLLYPGRDRKNLMKPFQKKLIAHRGLFDNMTDHPENSLPAFQRAVDHGFGIELDVQMTRDHKLVVFHDDDLIRMCGENKLVTKCSFEELQQYRLARSQERIPLLSEVLKVVRGQVPMVVEIKSAGDWLKTTQLTDHMLRKYQGTYCVESFHPLVVAWMRRNHPEVARGQLAANFYKDEPGMNPFGKIFLSHLLFNWVGKPDFIAYNHKHASFFSYWLLRKIFPVTNVCWTIKNQEDLKKADQIFDVVIFDSFLPEDKGREDI